MIPRNFSLALGSAAVIAGLGCSDQGPADRPAPYEWRLFLPVGAGPAVDTLAFHWPQGSLPVKIWVEDQSSVPDRVRKGLPCGRGNWTTGNGTLRW